MEELRNYKASTKKSIVNEMLKYGGLNILDMLARLVETLWFTKMVPEHWHAGDIVNIFKKGDRKDPSNSRGNTLVRVVKISYAKVKDSRLNHMGRHPWQATCVPGWLQELAELH